MRACRPMPAAYSRHASIDDGMTSLRSRSRLELGDDDIGTGDVMSGFNGSVAGGNFALIRLVRSSTVGKRLASLAASTRSDVTILPDAASWSLRLIRIVSPAFT